MLVAMLVNEFIRAKQTTNRSWKIMGKSRYWESGLIWYLESGLI